jgi:5-methylcytosine-specific restriction endonuclease McrA
MHEIGDLLVDLQTRCDRYGIPLESFLREKLQELDERGRTLATPSIAWYRDNATDYPKYLSQAFARQITPEEASGPTSYIEMLKKRINIEGREELASDLALKQNLLDEARGRCKSCGFVLTVSTMRVDHVVPLAEGGSNLRGNLQALCEPCNQGKADYVSSTILGAARPWFERRSDVLYGAVHLTRAKRFCVLLRDGNRCTICERDSSHTELVIVQRVPASAGGLPVYDNLRVVCSTCSD